MRDNYKKFLKQAESTGQSGKAVKCRRYHKWCRAEKVKFLENLGYGPSSKYKISSTSLHDCSSESEFPRAIQIVSTTSIPATPMRTPEIVYVVSSEILPNNTVPELGYYTTARTTLAIEPPRPSDPSYEWRSSTTKRSYNKSDDDGDRPTKKCAKCRESSESIDFLFKSYAETFKRFTAKKQVLLKLTLAKLFADAELDEMREPSVVSSSESVGDEQNYSLGRDLDTAKYSPDSDISSID